MRVPLSWLGEYVDLTPGARGVDVAESFVSVGIEEEAVHGAQITGPLVVGRVLEFTEEPQKNGKVIRWCRVDVGQHGQQVSDGIAQEIICGAHNFAPGDLVVVVLPGGVLPGDFVISARKTYGHVSHGMICSAMELGLGEDHDGIIILPELLGEEACRDLQPGDDAMALLGLGEEVVEVNITPDRGYCFSMRGLAREYWHSLGSPRGAFRDPAGVELSGEVGQGYPVTLTDEAPINGSPGCSRYVARVIRGIDPNRPSPAWMQSRLGQAGMRPISLAVDVTNYVMLALGQPLHAFDLDALSGSIVVRRARAGEKLTTLDDVERTLDPQDLMITDGGERLLAMAGVMGGAGSEIGPRTTNVLLESAHFDPTTVARSARRHRLITEASKRFERFVDPQITDRAAQLAADLLVQYGGGSIEPVWTDEGEAPLRSAYALPVQLPSSLVGVGYSPQRVMQILEQLGCTVQDCGQTLSVTAPSWRPDLVDGPDYAEEIARIDGYDRIPSVLATPVGGRGLTHEQRVRRDVANTLAMRGLVEVLTYPFVADSLADDLELASDDARRPAVRIANPLSEERPLMRTMVLASLVESLRRNLSRGHKDVGLFELGLVTVPAGPVGVAPVPGVSTRPSEAEIAELLAAVPQQRRHAALLLTGLAEAAGWWGKGRSVQWSDAIEAVQAVAGALGVQLTVTADAVAPWHPGRCASLTLPDGTLVGHAGELHPKVCQRLDIPERTCAAEFDVAVLADACAQPATMRPFSTYPHAASDIALVVPDSVSAGQVGQALRAGAGEALESISLFDVYEGEQLEAGHKSLAYRLTFRAADRTLTTDEVNAYRDAAVAMAAEQCGAVQR